jgi:hypothetical protein
MRIGKIGIVLLVSGLWAGTASAKGLIGRSTDDVRALRRARIQSTLLQGAHNVLIGELTNKGASPSIFMMTKQAQAVLGGEAVRINQHLETIGTESVGNSAMIRATRLVEVLGNKGAREYAHALVVSQSKVKEQNDGIRRQEAAAKNLQRLVDKVIAQR